MDPAQHSRSTRFIWNNADDILAPEQETGEMRHEIAKGAAR